MTRPGLTVLAELRYPFRQQSPVRTAMNFMTTLTILLDRCMLPDIWAALVGMALKAQFPGIVGFDHVPAQAAVGSMTGGAADLAFEYRMVRPLVGIDLDILVTVEADFRLRGLLPAADMEVVTRIAGYVVAFVDAQIPQVHAGRSFVTGETSRRLALGIDTFGEGENIDTAPAALFDMGSPRTMAGLTVVLGCRSLYSLSGMDRFGVAFILCFMTPFAGFGSDIAFLFLGCFVVAAH